ncbi:MAG: 50S ribosomal protein L15 [Phycisphaerales bacterium]|nr:50S ribosomal protein L15 [Phycisphaerales bacterium]
MMIHEITPMAGKYKARKRIGRGMSSGHGKTSGRGHKGAHSRSGFSQRAGYEGGQMPYFRRLGVRGFNNANFRQLFWAVNLRSIVALDQFKKGGDVTPEALIDAGLIRDTKRPLKILGDMGDQTLTVKLNVTAARFTESARRRIEEAGGSVNQTGTRKDLIKKRVEARAKAKKKA